MSIPYSLRINSATALRVHNGEAIPTSSGLFSLRIVRSRAACPSLRVRPGADRAAGAVAWESFQAMINVGGPPPRDGLPGEAKQFRHLDLRVAQLAAAKGTQSERLEDLVGQLPRVGQ